MEVRQLSRWKGGDRWRERQDRETREVGCDNKEMDVGLEIGLFVHQRTLIFVSKPEVAVATAGSRTIT
jgi:hypothetical protein